ncbi:MAG: DMT family transporter [Thermodesulfobacteriota bacterium]
MTDFTVVLVAVIGGLAITLQGQFMGVMDQRLGTKESVFITYVIGGIFISLILLATRLGNLKAIRLVPWYGYTSGLLGLVIVGSISYAVPRLGVSRAFTILVAAQFFVAVLIDHYGLFSAAVQPVTGPRLLGLALISAGVWLVVRNG